MEIRKIIKIKSEDDFKKLELMYDCGNVRGYERKGIDTFSVIFRISEDEKEKYKTNSLSKLFEIERKKADFKDNLKRNIEQRKKEIEELEKILDA